MNLLSSSYDRIGIIAGSLCMVHCIGTPFLFIAKACASTCCSEAPIWWLLIDYLFLIISFVAIFYSLKKIVNFWFKFSFWFSWVLLFICILNHSISLLYLPHYFIYIPATAIIVLHFYNILLNKQAKDKCCNNNICC